MSLVEDGYKFQITLVCLYDPEATSEKLSFSGEGKVFMFALGF